MTLNLYITIAIQKSRITHKEGFWILRYIGEYLISSPQWTRFDRDHSPKTHST